MRACVTAFLWCQKTENKWSSRRSLSYSDLSLINLTLIKFVENPYDKFINQIDYSDLSSIKKLKLLECQLSLGRISSSLSSLKEIKLIGSKVSHSKTTANQYPELLLIQDLIACAADYFTTSSQEEWDNLG